MNVKPNAGFMRQLQDFEAKLLAPQLEHSFQPTGPAAASTLPFTALSPEQQPVSSFATPSHSAAAPNGSSTTSGQNRQSGVGGRASSNVGSPPAEHIEALESEIGALNARIRDMAAKQPVRADSTSRDYCR